MQSHCSAVREFRKSSATVYRKGEPVHLIVRDVYGCRRETFAAKPSNSDEAVLLRYRYGGFQQGPWSIVNREVSAQMRGSVILPHQCNRLLLFRRHLARFQQINCAIFSHIKGANLGTNTLKVFSKRRNQFFCILG